jgi:hypothetical protein
MLRPLCFLLLPVALACGDAEPLEPTYENVAAIFDRSCGASSMSCHGGIRGNASFNLGAARAAGQPYTELLVGVESCQYSFMPRVDPGNPDNSWLMVKIEGAHDAEGRLTFEPDPGWDPGIERRPDGTFPPSSCPQVDDGELSFGYLMPQNVGVPTLLPQRELDMIREWIRIGAPGPGE